MRSDTYIYMYKNWRKQYWRKMDVERVTKLVLNVRYG